jgi:hypothetical protein
MQRILSLQWFLVPAICALIALLIGVAEYIGKLQASEPISLLKSIGDQIFFWLLWAIISPLILMLARRFPMERPRILRNLLIHFSTAYLCSALIAIMNIFFLFLSKGLSALEAPLFQRSYLQLALNLLPNTIIYGIFLFINLIVFYREQYQNQMLQASHLNAQLSNARLQALQMQLHPHFLFNTLHSITALVLKNENRDAVKMVNRLSEFLRLTLDNVETHVLKLEDEIEFTRRYLEIELIRFHDRLTVNWDIDDEALEAQVPNLILQPLVENAMRHGVDSHTDVGLIEIAAHLQNGNVRLEVRDNGKDFKETAEQQASGGLGLKNTRSRLSELYGGDYSFSLTRRENEWTIAQIVIPFLPVRESRKGEQQ